MSECCTQYVTDVALLLPRYEDSELDDEEEEGSEIDEEDVEEEEEEEDSGMPSLRLPQTQTLPSQIF